MSDKPLDPEVIERLAFYFHRNGYVRRVDAWRRKNEGVSYKKGSEVRLSAQTKGELREIRALLRKAKFPVSQPFLKAKRWCQPIYGIDAVARFLALVETQEPAVTSTVEVIPKCDSSTQLEVPLPGS